MDTLVTSSPKTLSWLNQIKTKVLEQNNFLNYNEHKYYASFSSSETNKRVCYLNPQKNQIRLFTKLPLSYDYELEPTPATGGWAELYPTKFVIRSESKIEKAIELIKSSWIFSD